MKPQVKQKLKIFYSLTMCFISLFCIVTCSLAWFARNENVNGTGMSVTVQKSSGLLGVEFFVEDKNTESGFLRAADQNSVTLGKYDLLTNDYRILVKVYVKNTFEADSLKFVARTSTDYFWVTAITICCRYSMRTTSPRQFTLTLFQAWLVFTRFNRRILQAAATAAP